MDKRRFSEYVEKQMVSLKIGNWLLYKPEEPLNKFYLIIETKEVSLRQLEVLTGRIESETQYYCDVAIASSFVAVRLYTMFH